MNFWVGLLCGATLHFAIQCVINWFLDARWRRNVEAQRHINGRKEDCES